MELVRKNSFSENEYQYEGNDNQDNIRTEDIYQCLQRPAANLKPRINRPFSGKNYFLLILLGVNILISTIILVVVSLNHQEKETLLKEDQKELWLLHENVFYLFWRVKSDCSTAEAFCYQRNATLVILTKHNKAWLQSKTRDKNFLFVGEQFEGSADDESDDQVCSTAFGIQKDQGEGFVCEMNSAYSLRRLYKRNV